MRFQNSEEAQGLLDLGSERVATGLDPDDGVWRPTETRFGWWFVDIWHPTFFVRGAFDLLVLRCVLALQCICARFCVFVIFFNYPIY